MIQTFSDPEKEAFRKHFGKRRKCWLHEQAFSPFPAMFSTHFKKGYVYFVICKGFEFGPIKNFVLW